MLDFYLITDEQTNCTSPQGLQFVGSIEDEEFELAKQAGLIEHQADYHGDFRWSSLQVKNKVLLLAGCSFRANTVLYGILSQAKAAEVGLVAFGD